MELNDRIDHYITGELDSIQIGATGERSYWREWGRPACFHSLACTPGWRVDARGESSTLRRLAAFEGDEEEGQYNTMSRRVRSVRSDCSLGSAPLAAVFLVFLLAIATLWESTQPETGREPKFPGSASFHGQWADGREAEIGAKLPFGVLELQSGLVELPLDSSTTLLLEARDA